MKTVSFSEPECCPERVVKSRIVLPASVSAPYFVYEIPLSDFSAKQKAIEFKSLMAKKVAQNPNRYEVKAGIVNSPAPGLQYVQGIGSTVLPGNLTRYQKPIRSTSWSALTPGGSNRSILGRLGATAYGAVKPERGYRCPEGYQFGGQFTNEQYTTCGKQLFALPAILLRAGLGFRANRKPGTSAFQELAFGSYRQQMYSPGTSISSRAADIPKVGKLNATVRDDAEKAIYGAMNNSGTNLVRLIRQDGFVLEPVVSSAVLRTVPDNRNMESSIYAISINSRSQIGRDELGLLSNSGVEKISYVLPNGGLLQLRKARSLTVGERRKLGKTVSAAMKMDLSQDPSARLRFVASEMGDGVIYSEKLNIKNPNDLISVQIAGGKTRTVRRWHYEAFNQNRKPTNTDTASSVKTPEKSELILSLSGAVRHLNAGGDISSISSSIRLTALKRSSLFKSKKFKDGINVYERADGLSLYEILPKNDFEHLGAAVASEIQQSLGLASPEVYLLGSGKRNSYLLTQAQDSFGRGTISRDSFDNLPIEDMLAVSVADWLTDTSSRNPSNIQPIKIGGRIRAVPGINPSALIGRMNTRYDIDFDKFFKEDLSDQWGRYFDMISREQKKRVVFLLSQLIDRAKATSISEISARLRLSGDLSSSEKTHLSSIEKLYDSRLKGLMSSKKRFLKTVGLGNE